MKEAAEVKDTSTKKEPALNGITSKKKLTGVEISKLQAQAVIAEHKKSLANIDEDFAERKHQQDKKDKEIKARLAHQKEVADKDEKNSIAMDKKKNLTKDDYIIMGRINEAVGNQIKREKNLKEKASLAQISAKSKALELAQLLQGESVGPNSADFYDKY
jgi:hypothetical protein